MDILNKWEICFVCANLVNSQLGLFHPAAFTGMWQLNRFVQKERYVAVLGSPDFFLFMCVVTNCFLVCSIARMQKNPTVTPKTPLCLPHSAARLQSRRPSTPAANITTSPPPAARGWGKKLRTHSQTFTALLGVL